MRTNEKKNAENMDTAEAEAKKYYKLIGGEKSERSRKTDRCRKKKEKKNPVEKIEIEKVWRAHKKVYIVSQKEPVLLRHQQQWRAS